MINFGPQFFRIQVLVRVSFNPIPLGEHIAGSRCSESVKWCHGRTLVAKSQPGVSDKYNTMNHHWQPINNALSHSTPWRSSGSGTGDIVITPSSGSTTEGYAINFLSNIKCELRRNGTGLVVDDAFLTGGKWVLIDSGNNVTVTIINDPNANNLFTPGTQINFTVLNDTRLFNNLKVR